MPSLGVGATEAIKKAGWDGESAALATATKLWGSQEGYKVALNLKDLTSLSFPEYVDICHSLLKQDLFLEVSQRGRRIVVLLTKVREF